jgi:hypothetical protein
LPTPGVWLKHFCAAALVAAAAAAVCEGALMLMLAKETEQRCMHVVKMQLAGVAIAAIHTTVSCSALQRTLAMCAASVLQGMALLSPSTAGHA